MSTSHCNAMRKKWTTGFQIKRHNQLLKTNKRNKVRKHNLKKKKNLVYFFTEQTPEACTIPGKYFMKRLILNKE